jgi:hypothetical protein
MLLIRVSFLKCVGVVKTKDLGRVMRAMGLEPSDNELLNMITEVDGSGARRGGCAGRAAFRSIPRAACRQGRRGLCRIHEDDGQERHQHRGRDQGDVCPLQQSRRVCYLRGS